MSQITTHILDTTRGKPATGVSIFLFQQNGDNWKQVAVGTTNNDGRIPHLLEDKMILDPGVYKMRFETKDYFDQQGIPSFYPYVEISFILNDKEHYHVPLLLNPYGYSTYRGS